jgi:hypothetical protein
MSPAPCVCPCSSRALDRSARALGVGHAPCQVQWVLASSSAYADSDRTRASDQSATGVVQAQNVSYRVTRTYARQAPPAESLSSPGPALPGSLCACALLASSFRFSFAPGLSLGVTKRSCDRRSSTGQVPCAWCVGSDILTRDARRVIAPGRLAAHLAAGRKCAGRISGGAVRARAGPPPDRSADQLGCAHAGRERLLLLAGASPGLPTPPGPFLDASSCSYSCS